MDTGGHDQAPHDGATILLAGLTAVWTMEGIALLTQTLTNHGYRPIPCDTIATIHALHTVYPIDGIIMAASMALTTDQEGQMAMTTLSQTIPVLVIGKRQANGDGWVSATLRHDGDDYAHSPTDLAEVVAKLDRMIDHSRRRK